MLTIGLAKGYLMKEALELFKKAGLEFENLEEQSRKLEFFDQSGSYRFLVLRPSDVPVYVEYGAADLGIAGKDVLLEGDFKVAELLDLKYGYCQLVVAALKKDQYKKNNLGSDLRIATKFTNSASQYFKNKGLNIELIKLYGSVELAPIGGLSDLIVDLVATGKTIKENGLEIVDTIYESTARLIANSIKVRTNYQKIITLTERLARLL